MKKLILGFAGEMAAGKGYATDFVKSLYPDTPSFRFSDSLREFYAQLLLSSNVIETAFSDGMRKGVLDDAYAHMYIARDAQRAFCLPEAAIVGGVQYEQFALWIMKEFIPLHSTSGFASSATTRDLQDISTAVRRIFGEDTLERAIMARVERASSQSPVVIVEGIRRLVDIVTLMADRAAPFRLVYVEADPRVRFERHKTRNEKPGDAHLSFEQFVELGKAEAEEQIRLLRDHAHIIISNSAGPAYLETVLTHFVEAAITEVQAT